MTRLFIRFYLGVLFVLFTAWLVQGFVVRQRANEKNERVVEQAMAGGLRMVRDRLNDLDESEFEPALTEFNQLFPYPVTVVKLKSELFSEGELDRLKKYDEIVLYTNDGLKVATRLPDTAQAVSFGPLPSFARPRQSEILIGLGLLLLLAAFAIAVLLRPVVRQLRAVERAATAIAEGDLSARIDPNKVPKGRYLARAFNTMAERIEELLNSQRELLQAVSHELRTPLARMRFAIDLISTAPTDEARQQRLQSLDADTEELDELVEELLSYTRMETTEFQLELQPIPISEVIENIVSKQTDTSLALEFDADHINKSKTVVRADSAGLQRVLSNLIDNACRFAGNRVRISTTNLDEHIAIDIEDDGAGIPAEDRSRVLEPFVRLDNQIAGKQRRGVGLGLAIVDRIVTKHGGQVLIEESDLGGCRIRTTWPTSTT